MFPECRTLTIITLIVFGSRVLPASRSSFLTIKYITVWKMFLKARSILPYKKIAEENVPKFPSLSGRE